jgi:hypothetical protein
MERCHKLTSFKLNVSEQELTDLHARLAAARWPDALENIGRRLGVYTEHLAAIRLHFSSSTTVS